MSMIHRTRHVSRPTETPLLPFVSSLGNANRHSSRQHDGIFEPWLAHFLVLFRLSSVIAAVMAALATAAAAADPPSSPPEVTLAVSPPFRENSVKHYRPGEDILKSPPFRLTSTAAMTEHLGSFGPQVKKQEYSHGWRVSVYASSSKRVAAICTSAKDALAADLQKGPGLLEGEQPSDMVARFRPKRFSWGSAVSFLSQTTQDAALFVPHNGHLQYEIWGVTTDQKYTVIATISVSHPKLANWNAGKLRVARSLEALKRDRDYKRIETCKSEEFEPSLTAFERMLDSLTIR